jgi:hypothetical protein
VLAGRRVAEQLLRVSEVLNGRLERFHLSGEEAAAS